ncbi:MAG TPA: glycosyltransferase family 9 protein [Vicinamibacterales bacterium]|nr:glycosyltransferase family 9 protein [Vicinamibacterales bacterium]
MKSPSFLLVRLGSLGDVIHAIPAAAALRARYPDARIDWLVDPRYVPVLQLVEGLDEAIAIDPRGAIGVSLGTIRKLRSVKYDAVVDLQGLLKSAALARGAGAQRVIGFPREHLREPMARIFYSETPDPGRDPHVVHKNLMLMRALGVDDLPVTFPLKLPRTVTGDSVAAGFGAEGYAVINPGAAWPNKRWPPQRFGALAAEIRERIGVRSLVLWGPGEEDIASLVVGASRGAAELAPKTNVIDLFAIARRAKLMVSGDTGPLHIAAAVGTPVVALFGPTFAERNGPWDRGDITISRAARCFCHYERKCRLLQPCIDDIGVDEVVSAAEYRVAARG